MVQTTKGDMLFVTGIPRPSKAEVMLKFSTVAEGGRALPPGPQYVVQVRFPGQSAPTNQLICTLKGEFTADRRILADVLFHGTVGPPKAFLHGTNFELIEGSRIVGARRVTQGEPAPAPGRALPRPVIPK